MPTISNGVTQFVTVPTGRVLNIRTGQTASVVVRTYPDSQGLQATETRSLAPNQVQNFGPYASTSRFALEVSGGVATYEIGDAGLTAPQPGLGVVATGCVVPSNSNTTNRQIMTRSTHIAIQHITELQTAWANWYVSANNTGELTAAGTLTLTASVEYPLGTIAGTFKWDASSTVSISARATSLTDKLSGLNIPAGALFAIRSYAVGTLGIVFSGEGGSNAYSCATFDVTGVADATQVGGAVTDTQAGIGYRPVAILGATTRPTIAIAGTSRPLGLNDTALGIYGGRGIFERAVSKRFGYIRMAASGERLQTILVASGATNYARRKELIDAYCTHILSDYGINDLNGGARTAAEVTADLRTAVTLFGKPWIHATLSPIATSSNSFIDAAGQTTNATVNPKRITFNASLRNGEGGISGCLELADGVESARDSGKWKSDGSTPNLWTSDGTHESQYANLQLAAATDIWQPLNLLR